MFFLLTAFTTSYKTEKTFDNRVLSQKFEKLGKEFSKEKCEKLKKDPKCKNKTFNEIMDILVNEIAVYLNQFHPTDLNPQSYEGVFCYYRFQRIVHPIPRLRNTDAFGHLALRRQLFRMYDRIATSFELDHRDIKGTPGRTMYFYDLNMGTEHHYISVALVDLSNIIEGFPKNQGYCAVCQRVSKNDYNRGVRRQNQEDHTLDQSLNTLWNMAKVITSATGVKIPGNKE